MSEVFLFKSCSTFWSWSTIPRYSASLFLLRHDSVLFNYDQPIDCSKAVVIFNLSQRTCISISNSKNLSISLRSNFSNDSIRSEGLFFVLLWKMVVELRITFRQKNCSIIKIKTTKVLGLIRGCPLALEFTITLLKLIEIYLRFTLI